MDTVGIIGKEVGIVAHELDGAEVLPQLVEGGLVVVEELVEELVFDGEIAV